jgi:hypothetical protein
VAGQSTRSGLLIRTVRTGPAPDGTSSILATTATTYNAGAAIERLQNRDAFVTIRVVLFRLSPHGDAHASPARIDRPRPDPLRAGLGAARLRRDLDTHRAASGARTQGGPEGDGDTEIVPEPQRDIATFWSDCDDQLHAIPGRV